MTSPAARPSGLPSEHPFTGKDMGSSPQLEVFNRLLLDRIVVLGSEVEDNVANMIIAQLLYLEGQDDTKDIWLYINSPGGSVITSGMAIYDTMQFIKLRRGHHLHGPRPPRWASSSCAQGPPGKRYSPPPRPDHDAPAVRGACRGQAADIAIQAEQILYVKRTMAERIAMHTGQTVEQIETDFERDRWFTADQAKEYGMVDYVINRRGQQGS